MAPEKDFKICTKYSIVKPDGTVIELPENYDSIERIGDTTYCIVSYYDENDKLRWGIIDSDGNEDLGYDKIDKFHETSGMLFDERKIRYLVFTRNDCRSLWDAQKSQKLLGGKFFSNINLDKIAHNLVPVEVEDKRAQKGKVWQLVDINTGKAVSPRCDLISLDYEYRHFFVLTKYGKRSKESLFSTITHKIINCNDVFSRNGLKLADYEFSRDFALVRGDKKSKIVSDTGVVVDELSPHAHYGRQPYLDSERGQNIFYDSLFTRWYKLILNNDNSEPSVTVIEYRRSAKSKNKPVVEKVKSIDHAGRVKTVKKAEQMDKIRQKMPQTIA